jgi:chemotaxis protein CheD
MMPVTTSAELAVRDDAFPGSGKTVTVHDSAEAQIYLAPGQLHAAGAPTLITTVAGSGVVVCLWDPERRIGGACHYLLPHYTGLEAVSTRFGNVAISQLLQRLQALGCPSAGLRAKIFGGARPAIVPSGTKSSLGQQNIAMARLMLAAEGIVPDAEEAGGRQGLKINFHVPDGAAQITSLEGPPARSESDLPAVYLHPGQLHVAETPAAVTTILGSCIAICLWDSARRIGGISHFLLPHAAGRAQASPRFGNVAIDALLRKLREMGSPPCALQAKIFGGASVLGHAPSGGSGPVGGKNTEVARERLAAARVPVVAEDVGGAKSFFTPTTAWSWSSGCRSDR